MNLRTIVFLCASAFALTSILAAVPASGLADKRQGEREERRSKIKKEAQNKDLSQKRDSQNGDERQEEWREDVERSGDDLKKGAKTKRRELRRENPGAAAATQVTKGAVKATNDEPGDDLKKSAKKKKRELRRENPGAAAATQATKATLKATKNN